MEIAIRRAEPAEHDAVARLTVAAYRAGGQLVGEAAGYRRVLADVAGRATTGEVLVALDPTGAVLGAVTFVLPGTAYAQMAGPDEAEFRMLAVDPAAQGRGIGEALVRACVARALENGAGGVIICTPDVAHAARRLYDRLGFVRQPERDWSPVPGVRLLALRLDLRDDARAELREDLREDLRTDLGS